MGDSKGPLIIFLCVLIFGACYFYGLNGLKTTAVKLNWEMTTIHNGLFSKIYRPEVTSVLTDLTHSPKTLTSPSVVDQAADKMRNTLLERIDALDRLQLALTKNDSPKVKAGQCCKYKASSGKYDKNFFTSTNADNVCFMDGSRNCFGIGSNDCENAYANEEFLNSAKTNRENVRGIAWQYFGEDSTGMWSNYPSSFVEGCDKYDPRLRPWYFSALSTKPMDVIVIVDTSGSMMINDRQVSANTAAKTIVNMLLIRY